MAKKFKYEIRELSDAQKIFDQIMPDILIDVSNEAVEELQDIVQERWYDRYVPTSYERMGDDEGSYKKSASRSNVERAEDNKGIEVEVFFDSKKIRPERRSGLNAHASFNMTPVNHLIPQWMEYGNPLIIKRNDEATRNGIRSMEFLYEWLDENYKNKVSKKLKKYTKIDY